MLEIKDLSYAIKGDNGVVNILKNVTLSVADKKFVVITGPNGSGKTTLAKAVMGLVVPTSGSIFWNGNDITHAKVSDRAKTGISYGFQQPARFKGLRVLDLLEIAAGKKLTADECCHYLNQVGLCSKDYMEREINAGLSGGEVKRIEIATVLARNTQCMIFDEPEAGIDLWSFTRLTETFKGIHDAGTATLLVISHQERIIDLADEIILISGGELLRHGTKAEILPFIGAENISKCDCLEAGIK